MTVITLPRLDIRRLAADFSAAVRDAHTADELACIRNTGNAGQFLDDNDLMAEAISQQLGDGWQWPDQNPDDIATAYDWARESDFNLSRILIACEFSGAVRTAFAAQGHSVMSCDTLPSESPGPHYQGDVRDILSDGWHAMIAFPPCTYLCSSGLHWNKKDPERAAKTESALAFIWELMTAPIKRIAVENPVGAIGTRIRPADQYIQPYEFGHDASKKTGLWLDNLPKLVGTKFIPPRIVTDAKGIERERWGNQTDSGQNRLGPSADRWKDRSRTYAGIADAMACQWGTA